jgi:uncharacterized protein
MRLKNNQACYLKNIIHAVLADADIYLFGSRVNDRSRGGDIDILVIGKRKLTFQQMRDIKIAFYKKFGEQKIDIVTYKRDESSTFRDLAMLDAIQL